MNKNMRKIISKNNDFIHTVVYYQFNFSNFTKLIITDYLFTG